MTADRLAMLLFGLALGVPATLAAITVVARRHRRRLAARHRGVRA